MNEKGLPDNAARLKKHIYEKRRPLDELISLFEQNDFKIKNIIKDSFCYRYLDATTMFNHSLIRIAFLDSWLDLVPARIVDDIFTEVEKRLNQKSKDKGEMVLTIPFVLIDAVKI